MLTERLRAWQIAQPLYGAGPAITAAGVGFLAAFGFRPVGPTDRKLTA